MGDIIGGGYGSRGQVRDRSPEERVGFYRRLRRKLYRLRAELEFARDWYLT